MRTPNQRLADVLLGEPVEDWLARQREMKLSWRRISLNLLAEKDIDVAPGTLMTWLDERDMANAERAS